jgi:hypothetical protein
MDRFDPKIALEELTEDAALPHPVRMRDMIKRRRLIANFRIIFRTTANRSASRGKFWKSLQ